MGTIGTFDSFTSARLGIYAAQHGLRVTGNNISNINTAGYTRQRINQVSLKTGGHDMYYSQLDNHVGNGALVKSINQIRDPTWTSATATLPLMWATQTPCWPA